MLSRPYVGATDIAKVPRITAHRPARFSGAIPRTVGIAVRAAREWQFCCAAGVARGVLTYGRGLQRKAAARAVRAGDPLVTRSLMIASR